MKLKHSYFYVILILVLLIGIGMFMNMRIEKFEDYAPYESTEKPKIVDNVLMDSRLKEYQKLNHCQGGYIDLGLPPPNPIYEYPTLNFRPYTTVEQERSIIYGDPFDEDYQVGIMGNV